jgi:circadian clock protein KaiC
MTDKVSIRRLRTGVPGLDDVLGGGLPEFSFNLIAGGPGAGKTTLSQQIMFAIAGPERRAVYFTVLGEPALKMLRYQQQFTFFDLAKIDDSIPFVNLAQETRDGGLGAVLKRITEEVERTSPAIVMVDSFRSIAQAANHANTSHLTLQDFVQELALRLTGWETTSFLVGEYQRSEADHNPVFTVADGLFWLDQAIDRNSVVRKMQVVKMRGQASIPGLHTFRITDGGLQVFPRMIVGPGQQPRPEAPSKRRRPENRLSTGIHRLDEMLGGGVPAGFSILVAGPSGSGKTILATEFITAGADKGEPGVIAVFEKRPDEYSQVVVKTFDGFVRRGKVGFIHTRPLDLSIDETLYDLTRLIHHLKAKRVVIDSLSGFELALAPTFREDFRESLYRMVTLLTGMGITILMTAELEDTYTELRFSPHGTAFLTDAIIMQRYVELSGQLKRIMSVIKLRGSAHAKEFRLYDIADDGIVIGDVLKNYEGLLKGSPFAIGHKPDRATRNTRRKTR